MRSIIMAAFLLGLTLCMCKCVMGAELRTLEWDTNPESDLAGYKVYQLGSPNLLLADVPVNSAVVEAAPGAQLAVLAYNVAGLVSPLSAPVTVPVKSPELPRADWKVVASSEETVREATAAANAVDGDEGSFWHTQWSALPPHYLRIELPRRAALSFLRYLPRSDHHNGRITAPEVELSDDGVTWALAAKGAWEANASEKTITLGMQAARYVRIWGGDAFASAAEVRLHGVYEPEPPRAVKLTMQSGSDLAGWSDMTDPPPFTVPATSPRQFFRLKIETP